MAKPGEYSDMLRAIGRLLEQRGAGEVEIIDEGRYLSASWRTDDAGDREQRTYRAFELDRLRFEARLLRSGAGDGVPQNGLSEMLRSLGNELDDSKTELLSVLQTEEGFLVSAMVGQRHSTRLYSYGEINTLSLQQRARRRPVLGKSGGNAPNPTTSSGHSPGSATHPDAQKLLNELHVGRLLPRPWHRARRGG